MIKRKSTIERDPLEDKLEKNLKKLWKIWKKESRIVIKWVFFYKPEDKMDELFHIITIISYIIVGVSLARGW